MTADLATHLARLTDYDADEWTKALVHLPAEADDERLLPRLVELARTMRPYPAVRASWPQEAVLVRDVRVRRGER